MIISYSMIYVVFNSSLLKVSYSQEKRILLLSKYKKNKNGILKINCAHFASEEEKNGNLLNGHT